MLKGFKSFILRGNIAELAIAVVIGTAFTALVSSFTKAIINPVIASAGGTSVEGLSFHLIKGNQASLVDVGGLITAIITFVITAAVVYFVFVVPMNAISARRKRGEVPADTEPTELDLLVEIRDLLKSERQV